MPLLRNVYTGTGRGTKPFPPPSSSSDDDQDDQDEQAVEIYPYEGDKDTGIFSVSTDSSSDESDDDEGTDSPSHPSDGTKSVIDNPIAAPERLLILNNEPTVVSKLGSESQPIGSPKIGVTALSAAADRRQITGDMEVGGSSSRPHPSDNPRANDALFAKLEWLHMQRTIKMFKEMEDTNREIEMIQRGLEKLDTKLQGLFGHYARLRSMDSGPKEAGPQL
ncbi:hypothetical protein SLS53_002153 [Cytospora paraplurivora]|uniref:Uncharacterized protein n=1 Tax=Cytospora paraplurivora TaxID=2898453 RepID=A0AAN9UI96_9PEZI